MPGVTGVKACATTENEPGETFTGATFVRVKENAGMANDRRSKTQRPGARRPGREAMTGESGFENCITMVGSAQIYIGAGCGHFHSLQPGLAAAGEDLFTSSENADAPNAIGFQCAGIFLRLLAIAVID